MIIFELGPGLQLIAPPKIREIGETIVSTQDRDEESIRLPTILVDRGVNPGYMRRSLPQDIVMVGHGMLIAGYYP